MSAKTISKSGMFSPDELTVLKSLALGLSCEDIRTLIGVQRQGYESMCYQLFQKLGVSNHYMAVKAAFEKKHLDRKDLSLEDIKSFTLEFAYQKIDQLQKIQNDPKQLLWELYDLLLEYHSQLDEN